MSVFNLNKIFYLVDVDADFLSEFKQSPETAISRFNLLPSEKAAVLSGDINALYKMGVHTFLLTATVRHNLLGVTRDSYERQIKSMNTLNSKRDLESEGR